MYSLLIHFYAFVISLISPFHRKAKLMRKGQRQTYGILRSKIQSGEKYIWFHAASLGEFEQGRPMMEKIKMQHPEFKILLTFFSPSGYEVRKNFAGADVVCYLPFDTPSRVNKFLDLAHPKAAVFIKYEFWGNYLSELKRRDIPVFIISAVFRREQFFFQWFGAPYRKMLFNFTHLFVQDEYSKKILAEYGITNVTVSGDTRFDRVLDIRLAAKDLPLIEVFTCSPEGERQLTLVAGSSWPQDEAFLIPYFNEKLEMKLIIAPHEIHESHLQAIEAELHRPAIRLSQVRKTNDLKDKDCIIVDSFGLLSSIYRYGQIAYVGGGFGAGIHNTLEAAVYGVPVLFGPNFHKFKEAEGLQKAGGGFPVGNKDEFVKTMDKLLGSPEEWTEAGKAADDFVRTHVGATDRILSQIIKLIATL